MKESMGGIGIFMIVIMMIILFAGIMSLTVNRSNSFAIKDEIISIIEKNGSFDMEASWNDATGKGDAILGEIIDSVYSHGYRQTGPCPKPCESDTVVTCHNAVACYARDGSRVYPGDPASIIILRTSGISNHYNNEDGTPANADGTTSPVYYTVMVYYRLDLPVLNNVFAFKVMGQTKPLYGIVGQKDNV